jgi:hypothetical protein
MKTSELTGAALDWAVHVALYGSCEGHAEHDYSTDWSQGGPIIDREDIAMSSTPDGLWAAYAPKGTRLVQHGGQTVEVFNWTYKQQGYHPLIAAMRCYVASKLGDDINIPEELL